MIDIDELERIMRACGAPVDRAALRGVLSDDEHGAAFADWARVHLGPDNLLSRDELTLYHALDKSGQVDRLVAGRDLAGILPWSESEIQTAIEELDRSTAAIAKQTETLKQQQEALARLVKANVKNQDARADLELRRAQRRDAERKRATAAVEELSQTLDFRTSDLEQQSQAASKGLVQAVDSLLHSDDRLLSSLQKLGWELETQDPEEEQTVSELREICMRLIKHTVETIRTKLDRLYLESLMSSRQSGSSQAEPTDDVEALQEELESLYAEILPVAQMSVEQQYLEPALKSLSDKNGQRLGRSSAAVDYILECLDYLIDHARRLSTRLGEFRAHQVATATLVTTAKAELSTRITPPTPKPDHKPPPPGSPTRRRKSSGHSSPVRLRSNTAGSSGVPRRRSSGALLDEPPLDILLRNLALPLALQPSSADAHSTSAAAPPSLTAEALAALSATLADRTGKADDMARNAQEAFEAGAASQVADARRAVQLLRDSVLAESPFGGVQLVDPEIEASIAVLAQEVDKARARVEAVDMAGAKRRSERRAELVQRWGR